MMEASQGFFQLLNVKQESCECQFFEVFSLTRSGIEPRYTVLLTDALSTRSLICNNEHKFLILVIQKAMPYSSCYYEIK